MTMPMRPIYMDNHSTTRIDPRVLDAMLPFFSEKYGNAASVNHSYGEEAARATEQARQQVADLLNTSVRDIIFTSGATESNNIALKGVLYARGIGNNVITTAAEHRAVLDPVIKLNRQKYPATILSVDDYGMVDPGQIADAIKPHTVLVSVIMANNEVGTINDLTEIGRICRKKGVLLHTDAVQAVGKIPVDLSLLPVDLLSLSAHKLYGPKGVGVLYVRREEPQIKIDPLFDGGGHENRIRSGTLPVPLIVGFGKACELARECMMQESAELADLRDRLWEGLSSELKGVFHNGHPQERLAGNLNVSFEGVDGDALMMSLKDVAVSSGSACTSANPEPSHVLKAMGVSDVLTRSSLRFGLGRFNTVEEVDQVIQSVVDSVRKLRSLSSTGSNA
jgi:cysteine desulfurase